jgi:hypothetical protein
MFEAKPLFVNAYSGISQQKRAPSLGPFSCR